MAEKLKVSRAYDMALFKLIMRTSVPAEDVVDHMIVTGDEKWHVLEHKLWKVI